LPFGARALFAEKTTAPKERGRSVRDQAPKTSLMVAAAAHRAMRFFTLLNQDVELIIRNRLRARPPGRVFVTAA
jgi:hypothetical protein